MTLKLTTAYHLEGKYYVAYCAELGVTSQGETLEEAEKNLREAIELYLEDASTVCARQGIRPAPEHSSAQGAPK